MILKMILLTMLWVVFIGNISFETLIIGAGIGMFLIRSDIHFHNLKHLSLKISDRNR